MESAKKDSKLQVDATNIEVADKKALENAVKPKVKAKHDEQSDYSDWDLDDKDDLDKQKAHQTKKDQENKQNLKDFQAMKAAGGGKMTEDIEEQRIQASNEQLDSLWEKVRDRINDMTDEGPKRDFRGGDKATRIKFIEALDVYDPRKSGTVPFKQLIQAFVKVKICPAITEDEIEKLVTALEAWHSKETRIVKYSNFLDGSRESESLYGIFPKHQPRGPSKQELERKAKAEEDEKKRQEAIEQERLQKIQELEKKTQRKSSDSNLKKPLSKEEIKRQQRDEQIKLEGEKKEKEKLEKLEQEAIKKDIGNLKTLLAIVRQKVRAASSSDIRKWFMLFDKDKSSRLSLNEFQGVLTQAGAKVSDKEASVIFQLIDKSGDFKISPDEFCDMIDEKSEPDYMKYVIAERAKLKADNAGLERPLNINSADAIDNNSDTTRMIGNVEGLSQIMGSSQKEQRGGPPGKLTDDEADIKKLEEEIKDLLKKDKSGKLLSFDDVLQMMQKPKFQHETEIHLEEFKVLIQSLAPGKFSLHELKQVFSFNAVNPKTQSLMTQKNESYIPLKDFKDKFCTQLSWKKESQVIYMPELQKNQVETESIAESIAIDHILQGIKPDDVYAIRAAEERKNEVHLEKMRKQLGQIKKEPSLDGQSQDSKMSKPISELVGAQSKDPRKKLQQKAQEAEKEERNRLNSKNLKELEMQSKKQNKDFFMQPEVVINQPLPENFMFDQTIEKFFKFFCKYLIEEANNCPVPRTIESYVEHYGKQTVGFINFDEFKEIFQVHVQQSENASEEKAFEGKVEEGKLFALFNVFDVQSRGKIPKNDFAKTVERGKPVISIIERMIAKVNKGGDRLIKIFREEFQEADAPFGCNGELPLNNFQVILADYDLTMLQSDIQSLEKQGYITKDYNNCRYVLYNKILSFVVQIRKGSNYSAQYTKLVVKIQAVWRGIKDRKRVAHLRSIQNSDMNEILQVLNDNKDNKKKEAEKQKTQKDKQKGAAAPGKKLDKKKPGALTAKERQKPNETLENKIGALIRPSKESKFSEKAIKERQELTHWIKNTIMEHVFESAFCYGESLISCRTIQKRYENRPVVKYLFPTVQEFQFTLQGVMPKSLQSINSLGQVIIIDSQNQLNQFDIPANRTLNLVNLGTKPPLKHYNIIDLVCDQESGRIYTLNANWILEIWNIEQGASFPQKRLAICSNEGNKDFISLYYKQTFNNAKPKFLSLQESNQQILIINTTCVDSSIVFVDPISFSILKKIQLRFTDFELPKIIRQSIISLQKIFDDIQKNQGKDMLSIFQGIIQPSKDEVLIKDLVNKLVRLDKTLIVDDLYRICRVLDADSSGAISLDEFLDFFSSLQLSENTENIEDDLQDELWPDWVVKEGHLGRAQTLLAQMFSILTVEHGITADQAFSFYDGQQTGLSSLDEFKRILKIFFSESFENPNDDIEFLVKLANKTNNKINYRDFCKYLSKKVVRGFRHAGNVSNNNTEGDKGKDKLTELEQPLVKQGSLSYVLRKTSQLGIDLSKAFMDLDPNELNVIPRAKFIGLLLELPLGINEQDVYEILENDLAFDNYGNVNYTLILSSDMYIALERNRHKVQQKKRRGVTYGVEQTIKSEVVDQTNSTEKIDNRKVVVEDLIFIDDLEVLIYTTIVPKSSKIFVTTVKKQNQGDDKAKDDGKKVINLSQINELDNKQTEKKEQQQVVSNYYELLAKLQGHKNSDPPSICYVPSSCCLISGEKNLSEGTYQPPKSTMPSTSDPSVPASHKFQTSSQDAYQKHAQRGKDAGGIMTEILIWNLQRDMIELFQNRPPWIIPYQRRIQAHNSSIIQIQYLSKAQLIVSCSTDQTIKFFDPISASYELTDPSNNPHAPMRPGYYKPLQKETTKNNITLREVKRIYTGNDTICFGLNAMNIKGIPIDPKNFQIKGGIEWLITCKLGRPQWQSGRNTQVAYLTGYGIERVQIEVPAIHHDDIVPPFVIKEAEEMVTARRRKLVSCFMMETQKTISKIFTQVQLQESNMSKIRKLFMKAILQRKELKYLNPEPLRQIYQLILNLPDRSKFKAFLASSGCSDKLSVSETFFYLQIFMQIHPLRTTQIEFEKSIQQFHDKHQRQFLKGVKRWSNQGTQKFADYLRQYGLDLVYLQNSDNSSGKKYSFFCTRERFNQYLTEEIKGKGDFFFSQVEIEQILNELDPFSTGLVQIALLQKVYDEEIQFYKRTNFSRPSEILDDIRTIVFPNKRIMLQKSLAAMDTECDGFLLIDKFIEAFQRAQVNISRDSLELLFNVMSENFQIPKTDFEPKSKNSKDEDQAKNKVISLDFFMKKLFQSNELREVDEIETALSHIKAALIYKGLDFSIIFAEQNEEEKKPVRRAASKTKKSKEERQEREQAKQEAKRLKEQGVDMTSYYTRFSQQVSRDEFIRRVASLQVPQLDQETISRLASFLALNQKNVNVIFLNTWLHHLRRTNTAFQQPDKKVLPILCAKILKSEKLFRSQIDSLGGLRGKRDQEKIISIPDLKMVLIKQGISYINQEMLLKEFTKGQQVHVEDLMARITSVAKNYYSATGQILNSSEFQDPEAATIEELRRTDYFSKVHGELRNAEIEIDGQDLLDILRNTFDKAKTQTVKAYELINVIKYNYPVFSDECLIGLQLQLEALTIDGQVDYEEFIRVFFDEASKTNIKANEIKLDGKRNLYNLQEYEELLGRLQTQIKHQGLDLMKIFEIFQKQEGYVKVEDMQKILDLVEFTYSEYDFEVIKKHADPNGLGLVDAYDFVNQITFASDISPQLVKMRWINAAQDLDARFKILEKVQGSMDSIKEGICAKFQDSEGRFSGVIPASDFYELLSLECPSLSESEKQAISIFAIKGSRRLLGGEPYNSSKIDVRNSMIQFNHFENALEDVIQDLRRQANAKNSAKNDNIQGDPGLQKFREQIDQEMAKKQKLDQQFFGSAQAARQETLKSKIISIFQERDVSFFDCFQNLYDPLNSKSSIITITDFKKKIRQLNLPLSVHEQRIMRRIADPQGFGKVDIKNFCLFFETAELKRRRLNKILDKIATAFFLQGFNMRRAFALFDADGTGRLSAKEFRQGMQALNLHMRFDEIDDIMQLCDTGKDGEISYDEFISKMDLNIKNRQENVMVKVEDAFFVKLHEALQYSDESIYESMQSYDLENDGTIDSKELIKVIRKLGIMNPEPHFNILMKAGKARPTDKRISYTEFSSNLLAEINKRQRHGLSIHEELLQKINTLIKSKEMSIFDFFVTIDVNLSGSVSKIEFKCGLQSLGLHLTNEEFESVWHFLFKSKEKMPFISDEDDEKERHKKKNLQTDIQSVTYMQILNGFILSGCLKPQKLQEISDQNQNKQGSTIIQERKKLRPSAEQEQTQQNLKDDKWKYQACIKIHSAVMQKGLSYRRLFNSWLDKTSKSTPGRLNEKELIAGIKKLRAGLTTDEIDRLCGSLTYTGRELSIGNDEFEAEVRDNSRRLESERGFERMLLQEWITQFNECLARENIPIKQLFYQHDTQQKGSLSFENFVNLNQYINCSTNRKDLQRIFSLIDRSRAKSLNIEDLKNITSLMASYLEDENSQIFAEQVTNENEKGLKGEELLLRQEVNDFYQNLKETLESKNITLDQIVYHDLKISPNQLCTVKGLQSVFEKIQLIKKEKLVENIIIDIRKASQIPFEINYKNMIDFFTRQRINTAFASKGFVDPLIAQAVQAISKVKDGFSLSFDQLFNLFKGQENQKNNIIHTITRDEFFLCCDGLQLDIGIEDLKELFKMIDEKQNNKISKVQFVDTFTFITNKLGGSIGASEAQLNKSLANQKKSSAGRQQIMSTMQLLADSILKKQLQIRQLILLFDINRTGFISYNELNTIVRGILEEISVESVRQLHLFFDPQGRGKISVAEVIHTIQEIMNGQVGGGIFAFLQVKPIIQSIIGQLAIDCDKFFDELAEINDQILHQEAKEEITQILRKKNKQGQESQKSKSNARFLQFQGLSKRVFFQQLEKYGISLSQQQKQLLCQTFSFEIGGGNIDDSKLDYQKIDQAFEAEQQILYAQEKFYTVQWERRIFKIMGQYLRKNRLSIEQFFDAIDDDKSDTVSISELRQAMIRCDLRLTDRQLNVFMERISDSLGNGKKDYVTRQGFVKKFWSAYTYEDSMLAKEDGDNKASESPASDILPEGFQRKANRGRIESGLKVKLRDLKILSSIQARMKSRFTANDSFNNLDSGVGFLTALDLSKGLPTYFDLALPQQEIIKLFCEIDTDEDGIIKFEELQAFYQVNFGKRIIELEAEKERMITQFDIFDHLMKVLTKKGMTLEEMFDQIDIDKNQFIEVGEFHTTLESMGFMITEDQVFELMRQMDENFDGRISYQELKKHIIRLGFEFDGKEKNDGKKSQQAIFAWRDKGLEILIQSLSQYATSINKSYQEYFSQYDYDFDGHLTPKEFRMAILNLQKDKLMKSQIERIMHILIEQKKAMPFINIERLCSFMQSYKCLESTVGSKTVLIDEDLFVYIVERYDGLSRLQEQSTAVEERASYLSRHPHEIKLRGLDMLANQVNLQKLHHRASNVNLIYDSTLILLAGQVASIIRDEAQLCVLDPTTAINTITNDQGIGLLNAIHIPFIENSIFDVDFNSMEVLPSGALKYKGFMPKFKQKIEVLVYGNDCLSFVSGDGKLYKRHLENEIHVHRYLMGAATLDEEGDIFSYKGLTDDYLSRMDIFPNIGKFEKKIGLSSSDKEIHVINELIDTNEWINMDEFVFNNGGILNIPLFFHTDAPLFIIRLWAKLLLDIIQKVHDVQIVLRCLNLGQIWVSKDGQRIKLGHIRGAGKVNDYGYISSCSDIYLNLDNNGEDTRGGRSSSQSPSRKIGAPSSSKTDGTRNFSNACLDNPFIAPETIFQKFMDQTSACDVWSFGMIMYCLLFGKKPKSFYSIYRDWLKRCHGLDTQNLSLPFTPPSQSNFLYDPFSIDFEKPFDSSEDLQAAGFDQLLGFNQKLQGSASKISFENFIKCLKDMSFSSLFTKENSKKFHFKSIDEQLNDFENEKCGKKIIGFPGQSKPNKEQRLKLLKSFAKEGVLARKNELGLILDLISSCLDFDSKKRPTIPGLRNSPLFKLDNYELTQAQRFSQNVILYRSPISTVSLRITTPLRAMCSIAIKDTGNQLLYLENDLIKLINAAEECIYHLSSAKIDQINEVLTQDEKKRFLYDPQKAKLLFGKDTSGLSVSPNTPLAAQIIDDKVIDMLIFLTFRFTKAFSAWKQKILSQPLTQKTVESPTKQNTAQSQANPTTARSRSVKFDGASQGSKTSGNTNKPKVDEVPGFLEITTGQGGIQKAKRVQNLILQRMTRLLRKMVHELHSYSTPLAPYVSNITEYIVKFFVGEEYALGSDNVLQKTTNHEGTLKDYLKDRSFFRRELELNEKFKADSADQAWFLEQKNLNFLDKSNYWNSELNTEASKVYRHAITESGLGQSCYPVLNDYLMNVSNSFEPSKIFSKQMNSLSLSYLIPMNRTAAYYNELVPIAECLKRLYSPELEKAGKRCALAMIRSVFQTGSSDKIKACLDLRMPKHLIHFVQDPDSDVRRECLLTLLEISKGLQDEDFEIMGRSATNLRQDQSRRGFKKTAFDQHKAVSLASQPENVQEDTLDTHGKDHSRRGIMKKDKQMSLANQTEYTQDDTIQDQDVPMEIVSQKQPANQQKLKNQTTVDSYSAFIKRTIALIEGNENKRFINYALDLPNLNFLSSKRFLKEMASCFESPVFIAPLTRLLKSKTESFQNQEIILNIMENLFCGNEKVLTALNTPVCDTYMTLLRMLMQSTKIMHARANPTGLSAQMKNFLNLQDRAVGLFRFMFEQRRPSIIKDISCIGAASTLLREQNMRIPELINLPDIVGFFEEFTELKERFTVDVIQVNDFILFIKDLRCWVKYFFIQSSIPVLTKVKAVQRCCSFLVKVVTLILEDYENLDGAQIQGHSRKTEYLTLIKATLQLFDWLCVKGHDQFLFSEETGRANLRFIINFSIRALSKFKETSKLKKLTENSFEDILDANDSDIKAKKPQSSLYDLFPFTEISAILQNIIYQLVRKNDRFLNRLLSEEKFGQIFGEQLELEYDFIRHCIDKKIESLVLIDFYVKKNEIRLNTFEYLLRSSEITLKDQFLESTFIDRMFHEYVGDFREFNVQFSKIDLEFLAFRRSYPIRLECISLINTALMLKTQAPRIYSEFVMYARRHFLIKQELDLLRRGRITSKESTALLLFAIILESNEDDLIHAMVQEGAPDVLRLVMRDHPALSRNFPILENYSSPFI